MEVMSVYAGVPLSEAFANRYLERLLRYIVVRSITHDLIVNSVDARVGRGGKVGAVSAVVQAVLHHTALDVALADEHLRRAVVNQSGLLPWAGCISGLVSRPVVVPPSPTT